MPAPSESANCGAPDANAVRLYELGVVVPTATAPEKLAAAAVRVPVKVGDALKTAEPVPVSFESESIRY